MTLEFEKSYDVVMYPQNLKSYINIDKKNNLIVKGIAFNKFTLEYREMLNNVFRAVLTNSGAQLTPQDICYKY